MIHNVDQNSEAWENLRRGKLTASQVGEWLVADPKLTLKGTEIKSILDELEIPHKKSSLVGELAKLLPANIVADNQGYLAKDLAARRKTMCRMIGQEFSSHANEWMGNNATDFGNAFEDEACSKFEIETGFATEKIGFVTLDGFNYFGASPDRMVYSADKKSVLGPLEVKCKPEAHAETVINGILPPEHRLQVHFQMVLTGCEQAWFYAYSPDMESLIVPVQADGLTRKMEQAMVKFDAEYSAFREEHLPKLKPQFPEEQEQELPPSMFLQEQIEIMG
jgi:hypothetical protein